MEWTKPPWLTGNNIYAEGRNESCYEITTDADGTAVLWWRTRTGTSRLGTFTSVDGAKDAALAHHNQ